MVSKNKNPVCLLACMNILFSIYEGKVFLILIFVMFRGTKADLELELPMVQVVQV
jgi:hypothetical protein